MSKELQKEFDESHDDFVPYGEDGDYYAINSKVSFDDVLELFEKYWGKTVGEDESMPDCEVTWGGFKYMGEDDDLGAWKLDMASNRYDAKGIVVCIN